MTFFAGATNFTINYGRGETGPNFRHGDYIHHSSSTYSNESRVHVRRHDTPPWTRITMYDHTEREEYYDRDVETPHWINTQHNGSPATFSTSPNTQAHLSRASDYNRQYSRDRENYNQRREEYRQERERHRLEMERHRLEMERHRLDMERHRSERSYAQRENLHNFSINGGVFTVVGNGNGRSFGQSSFTNRRNNHSDSFRQHQEPRHSYYHSHPDNYVEEDIDHLPPGMFEQNPRRDPEVLYESPAPSYNERFSDPVLESGPNTSEFVEADGSGEAGGDSSNGEFSDSADVPLYTKDDMFPVSAYTEAGSSL
ncbi:hypothetical protein GGU10DRAFT_380082 [Lentinula aff. detonsa]|uniref:Uncharacterized protein n=1 Tax=Lentinula aff. detonsa TaxID=2804958 RepID=A0AA38NJ57_9AGAR|nr:hypothetical protein GGU10DRAFT_380082 [Lentinula aff. detonsa]